MTLTRTDLFLWVIYPYICLTVFIVGLLYRYDTDPLGWTAKSSQLLERKRLLWGSHIFHWGILFAFAGHVMGIIIPLAFYRTTGVPDELYHLNSFAAGTLAGTAAIVGMLLLIARRLGVKRVLRNSTVWDLVALFALIITMIPGQMTTLYHNYEYRPTVGPWFRGLWLMHPNPMLMVGVPLHLKVHIIMGLTTFALTPFTRLVHIFSLPLAYLRRAPIIFRMRVPVVEAPENRPNRGS